MFKYFIEKIYLLQKDNLVYYDRLTLCKTRHYYDRVMKSKYLHMQVKVTFVDINNLKVVNDTYGHVVGSILIQTISSQLRSLHNLLDICRLGGDEFLLIGDISTEEISNIMNISYGSYLKESYESISSAVIKADNIMYKNKLKKSPIVDIAILSNLGIEIESIAGDIFHRY